MKIIKKNIPDSTIDNFVRSVTLSNEETGKHFAKLEERITTTVSKEQLETLYHIDGMIFRVVNDYVDKVIRPGYYLTGKNSLVKECEKWLDNIKFKTLIEEVVKDIFISGAGNGWCELGYNDDSTDIPSVRLLNPKLMDYIREEGKNKNVALDEKGDPVGFKYSKSLSRNETIWKEKTILVDGKDVWKPSNENDDGRDRIAHFKLFGLGEASLGNSPV